MCLFRSLGILLLFVILIPVFLLMMLFGRGRTFTFTTRKEAEPESSQYTPDEPSQQEVNKPIDQSTVEYIDYEEVDDKQSEN